MESNRLRTIARLAIGLLAGLLLHTVAGWWSTPGLAQGSQNTTNTFSTSASTGTESPPACTTVGSSRIVQNVTIEEVIGPSCTTTGDRMVPNPLPCVRVPQGPYDNFGVTFVVLAGTNNFNFNTHTETIHCVAAPVVTDIPTLSLPALLALIGLLAGFGVWQARRLSG